MCLRRFYIHHRRRMASTCSSHEPNKASCRFFIPLTCAKGHVERICRLISLGKSLSRIISGICEILFFQFRPEMDLYNRFVKQLDDIIILIFNSNLFISIFYLTIFSILFQFYLKLFNFILSRSNNSIFRDFVNKI